MPGSGSATPRYTAEGLGFPADVVAGVVRISLSPTASTPHDAAKVDAFLVDAVLRIVSGKPMPIHVVCKVFERTFKLPFRAFRQPSFITFLENHPQFQIFDAYVAPSSAIAAGFPPPSGAGPRYYALCDAIEEQDVVIWRLREELSSLDMAFGGLVQNSGKLRTFLTDSDAIKDSANALTFKVVCTTPQGIELPILIEPRGPMTADADEDVAVARKALTRIVEREVAILRKTDETIGLEMTEHKRQIATLRMRMEQEIGRLEAMYADAYSMVPFASSIGFAAPGTAPAIAARGASTSPRRAKSPARSSTKSKTPRGRSPRGERPQPQPSKDSQGFAVPTAKPRVGPGSPPQASPRFRGPMGFYP